MDNNDKALLEEEMKERLEKAVKARLKKEKAEANLKALEQKENDAKEEASHAHDEHADHDRKDCFQERLHKSGNIKSSVFFILVSLSVEPFPDIAARGT